MEEFIEELEEENCEVETRTEFDLYWTCKNCGKEHTEYDIYTGLIRLNCDNCGKKYEYYYDPY